jgi:tRNA pseudouridine38-40 synthase
LGYINNTHSTKNKLIIALGFVETQRGFHAKNKCDSRIYEYLLPSYTLERLQQGTKWTETPTTDRDVKILTEDGTLVRYMTPTDPKTLVSFRVNQDKLNKFKEAMVMFQGTHNFHNYTIARRFQDRAAQRFMIDIKVEDPVIIEGMEWISVKLHGQSFMLHQIRKMICKYLVMIYALCKLIIDV